MTPQGLLARLLAWPPLVEELRADPAGFAAAHGTDVALARSLAERAGPGLRLTATLTGTMREGQIRASFPGTFALAEDAPTRRALLRAGSTRGALTSPADLLEVGRELAAAADGLPDDERAVLLRDMIAYETLSHRAHHLAVSPPQVPGPPALAPGVVITSFDRPMAEVRRLLLGGGSAGRGDGPEGHGEPAGRPTGPTGYALRAAGEPVKVRCHRLPPALARLLRACDGATVTAGVAAAAGLPVDTAVRTIRTMAAKGFLTWQDDPGTPGAPIHPHVSGGN